MHVEAQNIAATVRLFYNYLYYAQKRGEKKNRVSSILL